MSDKFQGIQLVGRGRSIYKPNPKKKVLRDILGRNSDMRKIIQAVAVIMALFPSATMAQDFNAGMVAYGRGDYEAALKEFRPLAQQGNANAQYNLGMMYDNGEGVLQDYAKAFWWYRLAAEQGNTNAQYNLGMMYYNDKAESTPPRQNVKSDSKTALKNRPLKSIDEFMPAPFLFSHMWFNIAAANGHEKAREIMNVIAEKMDLNRIFQAQEMARKCLESGYRNCWD